MVLKVPGEGEHHDIPIREGGGPLAPRHMRYSPRHPQEGSLGVWRVPSRFLLIGAVSHLARLLGL